MQTTQCPVCFSDVIIDEGSSEKDLIGCLNCGADWEIASLKPPRLEPLGEEETENIG